MLQLWDVRPATPPFGELFRWNDYVGRPLHFLEGRTEMTIEAAGIDGCEVVHARLCEQIIPAHNRFLFLDFQTGPGYHTVTPTHGRERKGLLQWLY